METRNGPRLNEASALTVNCHTSLCVHSHPEGKRKRRDMLTKSNGQNSELRDHNSFVQISRMVSPYHVGHQDHVIFLIFVALKRTLLIWLYLFIYKCFTCYYVCVVSVGCLSVHGEWNKFHTVSEWCHLWEWYTTRCARKLHLCLYSSIYWTVLWRRSDRIYPQIHSFTLLLYCQS